MNSSIFEHRPFVRTHMTTATIMFLTILSLLPAAGYGMYVYGLHAALLMGICVAVSVVTELVLALILRRGWTILDYSAIVTGLIGGMILPPRAPLYFAVVLAVIAIVSKQVTGGIGKNYLNPAGLGKIVLLIAFRDIMMDFTGGEYGSVGALTMLANGEEMTLGNMLLGHVAGPVGTGSVVCVLIGAIFLLLVGVTDIYIPISYLAAFAVFWILFGGYGLSPYQLGVQFAGGSLLFTAFFMAQDNTTSPMSRRGKITYGILLGLLTGILRRFGVWENAALIALLVGNIPVRWIDTWTLPVSFGVDATVRKVRRGRNRRRAEADAGAAASASGYREFEEHVVPKGAMDGSETAGTINEDSMESFRNRRAVTYDTASMDPNAVRRELERQGHAMRQSMPVFGSTGTQSTPAQSTPVQPVQPVQQPAAQPYLQQPVNPVPQATMSFQPIPTFPNGQPMIDANGNPVPLLDPNGNPVVDAYGNMIWGQIPQQPYMQQPYMQQPVNPAPQVQPEPEPVSRDTDFIEVAKILEAARAMEQQGTTSELSKVQYMDFSDNASTETPAPTPAEPEQTAAADNTAEGEN